jgi:hypothetical protein
MGNVEYERDRRGDLRWNQRRDNFRPIRDDLYLANMPKLRAIKHFEGQYKTQTRSDGVAVPIARE